ncbi:MAG: GNAT family N-acetyltransferase [Clostridia bacterium]|nr:GNAT family N-acetyltransferase [Clostridia bacterium]
MLEISGLSDRFTVRRLTEADAGAVLALCRENGQFYQYCKARPTLAQVLSDMRVAPPGVDRSCKHYVGFYEGPELVAVMDIIDGYPAPEIAYIGFFMMNRRCQGRQIGSGIVRGAEAYLKSTGKRAVRLAIDRENPQSTHFWQRRKTLLS